MEGLVFWRKWVDSVFVVMVDMVDLDCIFMRFDEDVEDRIIEEEKFVIGWVCFKLLLVILFLLIVIYDRNVWCVIKKRSFWFLNSWVFWRIYNIYNEGDMLFVYIVKDWFKK